MIVNTIGKWTNTAFTDDAANSSHRQILLISGDIQQCYQKIENLLAHVSVSAQDICWLGGGAIAESVYRPIDLFKQILGREFKIAVYNAHTQFRPSALLALSGTVRRGGTFIMLCPPMDIWPNHPSVTDTRYISYGYTLTESAYISLFLQQLTHYNWVAKWSETSVSLPEASTIVPDLRYSDEFLSKDQAVCYQTLITHCRDKNLNQHVVLTAPRGRGKSSVIGLLADALIRQGARIHITSPIHSAVDTIFDKFTLSNLVEVNAREFIHPASGGLVKWMANDNAQIMSPDCTLIVIDEASSLPLPTLERFLKSGKPCIFSATTEGYEGSGQGFITRFVNKLKADNAAIHLTLSTPLRWGINDPVETLLNQCLLFQNNQEQEQNYSPGDDLSFLTGTLREQSFIDACQILTLLDMAHYQTSPDDMMRLYDAPDTHCIIVRKGTRIIGAAVINTEGTKLLQPVAKDIASGRRRVKGHLGAQALALQFADQTLATLHYWRINRIAILPAFQRLGIGSRLLHHVKSEAIRQNVDMLTSSFGHTSLLKSFWQKSQYTFVKQGNKQNKSSGTFSVLVVQGLTARGSAVQKEIQHLLHHEQLTYDQYYHTGDAPHPIRTNNEALRLHQTRLLEFANGSRGIDHLGSSLEWLVSICAQQAPLPEDRLFVHDYLQHSKETGVVLRKYVLVGKAEMIARLRASVERLTRLEAR